MWPPWIKPPKRVHSSPNSLRSPKNFSLSSFKDIENLFNEEQRLEPDTKSQHHNRRAPSILQRARSSAKELRAWAHRNVATAASASSQPAAVKIPTGLVDGGGIIVYFTSLRVVRRTFEDCWTVRSILGGYRVPIDDRDLSMDCRFIDELHEIMKSMNKKISLPTVFIGGKYIGGAEEIRRLQETGELSKLVDALPGVIVGSASMESSDCDLCGGLRFVLCQECSGSHKIYSHKLGFRSCTACNANGLVRCPSCFPVFLRCRSTYS